MNQISRAVDDFGPQISSTFMQGRVISKDEIEKEVREMKQVDSVYDFIQKNEDKSNDRQK